jgi:YVTN family beta-propeller protein
LPTCSPLIQVFSRDSSSGLLTLSNTIGTVNSAQLRGITVLQNGSSMYVVDQSNSKVLVVSLATNTLQTSISVGNQPLGISSNPTGTRVYVANFTSANVSVIDTSTNTVIATPSAGSGGTFATDVTPNGQFFYAVNASGQTVSQFNALTNTAIAAPIATGQDPDGLTVSPDGANLYVTNASNTDAIAFFTINSSTGQLTANGNIPSFNNPLAISMQHYVILPPVSNVPAPGPPAPGPVRPSKPTWVGVTRHNLALLIDFAAPEIGFYDPDLTFRVYVFTKDNYPFATLAANSSGVLIPYVRNEDTYWVTVTAVNAAGEGPPAEWVLSPAPDWAFYPKDKDGRPCPTPAQCR